MPSTTSWGTDQRSLSPFASVLVGAHEGRYPAANSLLVTGSDETVLIDPSVSVVERGGAPVAVDAIINSHCHEDHLAGNGLFADCRVHVHHDDLSGVSDIEALLDGYGLQGAARDAFRSELIETFHYAPRPDAVGFGDGARFDLGDVTVEAVHLPGHTAGHSGFRVGEVFYLSDIDLTGFGPYYGDLWSDLEQFEESLRRVYDEEAKYYVTSHHKGVVEGQENFQTMIEAFRSVIDRRHQAMLEYLTEPRSVDDMVVTRFIYRPHVEHPFADAVERRSAELHLARMIGRGEAAEVAPGRFQAT